jgi:hypothetical protein
MQTCSTRPITWNKNTNINPRSPNLKSPVSGAPGSTSSTRKSMSNDLLKRPEERKLTLSPHRFTRLISGLVSTELHGLPVTCTQSELNLFSAPPGQTCGDYMSSFFASGGAGYITNNATSDCSYCAYSVGDQFYEPLSISFDTRWRDLGILIAFCGSNLIFLFLGSRYLNFNRR